MATLYILGKYLPLFAAIALAKYLYDNMPVGLSGTDSTIGLPYGSWILLFAVDIALFVVFIIMCIKDPISFSGGLHENKTHD
ncbi:MAG: hypothetical protein DI628_07430 [Blastochloris viridis]|uniref:Uncharacterized protein n=1 Tax=Blastochloris viridis TaxID=1079 RepID=A0A6N4RAL5_BLAVI|nr:MAG: hypothetical protein DI628_07430 [Blastochloris viridis]